MVPLAGAALTVVMSPIIGICRVHPGDQKDWAACPTSYLPFWAAQWYPYPYCIGDKMPMQCCHHLSHLRRDVSHMGRKGGGDIVNYELEI